MEYGAVGGLLLLFILIDVALIERKLRRMMAEQERHTVNVNKFETPSFRI